VLSVTINSIANRQHIFLLFNKTTVLTVFSVVYYTDIVYGREADLPGALSYAARTAEILFLLVYLRVAMMKINKETLFNLTL
jgi:hypothetical protein